MKKVTLFIDKTLQEELNDKRFIHEKSWSLAYRAALRFLAEIIAYGSDPRIMGVEDCREGFNKFVCGCHAESNNVSLAFAEATRVEVRIKLLTGLHGLKLSIHAYQGRRQIWDADFCFNQKDGQPSCAGDLRL